jgi:hypothetical protein
LLLRHRVDIVANPIFESRRYRRDLAEARALEEHLRQRFPEVPEARNIAQIAGLDTTQIDISGAPSTFWGAILDFAARTLALEALLDSAESALRQPPKDAESRTAIMRVREVTQANGSLSPVRLLLSGDRPFLGRGMLRELVPELRNWSSSASILVVRGERDSGRTETQLLLDEGRDAAREKFVLLDELMPLESTLRAIWKSAGAAGTAPALGQEPLTTESATLLDFWTDVKEALETNDRCLWVLFDDLDKGAGRIAVRTLAEVLAIRLKDVSFQRRIRLVLLGYPDPQLPAKVVAALVRNDATDQIDESEVRAFVDFCAQTAGKTVSDPAAAATTICTKAKASTSAVVPYLEALNAELRAWYKGL